MARFLAPTRRKITWTLLGLLVLPGGLLLRTIPVQWDPFDLRDLGEQWAFALVANVLFFYVISCTAVRCWGRRRSPSEQNPSATSA